MLALSGQILLGQPKVDQVKPVGVFEADHKSFQFYIVVDEAQIVEVSDAFAALDVLWSIQGNYLAVGHHTDSVGKHISFLDVLGAQDDRTLLSNFQNKLPDLASGLNIKTRGRLIQDDCPRVAYQGHC